MEKRCRECGKKIENSQTLCDNCRAKRNGKDTLAKYPWWLLGLILPPVGLILYLIWKKR
ncbi:MAG: PLD nuclease N-terminal domain-containing protein [Clostridium sp.]|nr:MAG: PLD nuclease N-terminal domain-containing protein [Clostridium sp.]